MFTLPSGLPLVYTLLPGEVQTPATTSATAEYDVAFQGQGFRLSNSVEKPIIWQLADVQRQQIDQAQEAGEQTLTSWWFRAQSSFHGGAGQPHLEPAFQHPTNRIRFDTSKNADVWTPGEVTVLDGSRSITGTRGAGLVTLSKSGSEAIAYRSGSAVQLTTVGSGVGAVDTSTAITSSGTVLCLTTDGTRLFWCTSTGVYRADAASSWLAVSMYTGLTGPTALEWVHDRLMLADGNKVYELDTAASAVALSSTQLKYTHPLTGFVWDGFAYGPKSILAFGWDGRESSITNFQPTATTTSIPTIQPSGVIPSVSPGERILRARNVLGTYLVVVTTKGLRVGTFDTYQGFLTMGPLSVEDTTLGGIDVLGDGVYVPAQKAPDEPGLIRLSLGMQTDQAGRWAWAPDRVGPVQNANSQSNRGDVAVLPSTGRLVWTDDQGTYVSDPALTKRPAWVRTSRVRYGTVEPKLFKFGRVRGDFTNGTIAVTTLDPSGNTRAALSYSGSEDPGEFQLPSGKLEWLQLTFTLTGLAVFSSYQLKALPGTRRQQMIQVVVSCQDRESSRAGQAYVRPRSSRARLQALLDLAAEGDEIVFQEFQQTGVISTRVTIDQCKFDQVGRPTPQQYTGGDITITMRTVV